MSTTHDLFTSSNISAMLKNLKSLFVTTEEEQTVSAVKSDSVAHSEQPDTTSADNSATIDNTILERLLKAIEDNNQSGFDYLEYRRSLKSLAALPMEESIKFQSAFATASTMDVTLDKLLASIEFYKKVLENEQNNFVKASKEQYEINVEGRQKKREQIHDLIKEKSLVIQKITEEIRAHQNEMEELNKALNSADSKIKETTTNFNAALNVLISQMNQDAEKLKQYIK